MPIEIVPTSSVTSELITEKFCRIAVSNLIASTEKQIRAACVTLGCNWLIAVFTIYHRSVPKDDVSAGIYFCACSGATGAVYSVALTGIARRKTSSIKIMILLI